MTSAGRETPKRRRVRVAEKTLRRVAYQRDRFATAYGSASTPAQRLAVAADALRAAAAPGSHQPDDTNTGLLVDRVTDQVAAAVAHLHAAQQQAAERTIRADRARITRNERRRCRRANP